MRTARSQRGSRTPLAIPSLGSTSLPSRATARQAARDYSPGTPKLPRTDLGTSRGSLRSRFRRASPVVARHLALPTPTPTRGNSPSYLVVVGRFSSATITRTIRGLPGGLLERWGDIESGRLPEGDDTPTPWTEDDLMTMEAEKLEEIHRWGKAQEAHIEDDLEEPANAKLRKAQYIVATAFTPAAKLKAVGKAEKLQDEAAAMLSEAASKRDSVAEDVREMRQEARQTLTAAAERRQEAYEERIAELRQGLHSEIEKQCERYFQQEAFELESYDLQ